MILQCFDLTIHSYKDNTVQEVLVSMGILKNRGVSGLLIADVGGSSPETAKW